MSDEKKTTETEQRKPDNSFKTEKLITAFLVVVLIGLGISVEHKTADVNALAEECTRKNGAIAYMNEHINELSTIPKAFEELQMVYEPLSRTAAAHLHEIRKAYYEDEDHDQVLSLVDQFATDFPNTPELEEAQYLKQQSQAYFDAIAAAKARQEDEKRRLKLMRDTYYPDKNYAKVVEMANQFIADFPDSSQLHDVEFLKKSSLEYLAETPAQRAAREKRWEEEKRLLDQQEDVIEMMLEEGYDYEEAIDAAEALEYGDMDYEDFF